ncbi:Hypothetical protein SMAX5B_006075 [Scophthalmus maximus]|uniref:Uncharacterized protein n=1 Tax=Scophthalmus maximus TaxID=52904 RepID=A0A2U9BIF6_SCOMX|nr:Hypothetical protein SMAX5B_006075 [Scophthalmus maximus]AWP03832.1 Hypothetical protein SMAX5B_006075 [Scophthalmus maximus]AWP03833.1 Hypothetical protein SMAX5B_006075 [Scophthalmus maximus]AWP03835.1 Hypothetical protein SMAX5B_006075 [Scophthalmus maximus]
MDKRLLLVMLCLQVFLLITTFTSTDAAALEKDDRLQPIDEKGTVEEAGESKIRNWLGCWNKPGGCGILPRHFIQATTPASK